MRSHLGTIGPGIEATKLAEVRSVRGGTARGSVDPTVVEGPARSKRKARRGPARPPVIIHWRDSKDSVREGVALRLLLVSDLHCDLDAAASVVERSRGVDVVVGAGDFAVMRQGLAEIIDVLSVMDTPTILVPGNGESAEELAETCAGWTAARVLHGSGVEVGGVPFFGLGGGVPVTPFGAWSFDLSEDEARTLLARCPARAVLVSHSPPKGHVDRDAMGRHLGSTAVLETVETARPRLVVCGHIHASWRERSDAGASPIINAGPDGVVWDLV